ncbi:hypothetical protein BN134_751 [Cronobacter dublinensis 1210]|uniref:Uncharacterized protein n=1 Tax=Cronobacter dublinensis 1210 TaxID=1208656 RepID=A0ABM9Q3Q5_9ENTR|nr:hypothetical protein BN134_751 [Cronobacter dublinensis 1210]
MSTGDLSRMGAAAVVLNTRDSHHHYIEKCLLATWNTIFIMTLRRRLIRRALRRQRCYPRMRPGAH